jgi:hypothetical protein
LIKKKIGNKNTSREILLTDKWIKKPFWKENVGNWKIKRKQTISFFHLIFFLFSKLILFFVHIKKIIYNIIIYVCIVYIEITFYLLFFVLWVYKFFFHFCFFVLVSFFFTSFFIKFITSSLNLFFSTVFPSFFYYNKHHNIILIIVFFKENYLISM